MSDLMNFFLDFKKNGFEGNHFVADEHTLRLCVDSTSIYGPVLDYVVKKCPSSCRYFIGTSFLADSPYSSLYICVYDDYV